MPESTKKSKSLKVFEQVREGTIFWRTETKIPATMAENLGWTKTDDDLFEVERPLARDLPAFGKAIEGYGFNLKRLEQRSVVEALVATDEVLDSGKTALKNLNEAREAEKEAKAFTTSTRKTLQDWLVENAAAHDPAHDQARIAQIGTSKVHNSWHRGNQTKFDERDHKPVADWAEENDCAEEMVQVVYHKTVSFEQHAKQGAPEGFEIALTIDSDVYDWYVRVGAVPTEIHDAFEARSRGYYVVKVFETKEFDCPSCGHKMGKTQKFCGECCTKVQG